MSSTRNTGTSNHPFGIEYNGSRFERCGNVKPKVGKISGRCSTIHLGDTRPQQYHSNRKLRQYYSIHCGANHSVRRWLSCFPNCYQSYSPNYNTLSKTGIFQMERNFSNARRKVILVNRLLHGLLGVCPIMAIVFLLRADNLVARVIITALGLAFAVSGTFLSWSPS